MQGITPTRDAAECLLRAQLLAALEDLCRDLTLHDVREWYFDAVPEPVAALRGYVCD